MMFVDTWAWLALAYRLHPYHDTAVREHGSLQAAGRGIVTTERVVAEFLGLLFRSVSFAKAERFAPSFFRALDAGTYGLVFVTKAQLGRPWELRRRYRDKPGISFVDLTSMVVLQDLGIADIFTGDSHFQKVGLGFRLHPDPAARTPRT